MAAYDYVIVGAGSAGCVLANRLTQDPTTRVLLLEAGGSDRKMAVRVPAAFAKQFRSELDWAFESVPEPALGGRSIFLPRGKSLGGSSSMNAMLYVRGNRADYDGWAARGLVGWSYDDVLPYFIRSERNSRLGAPFHGQVGELHVQDPAWVSPLAARFVASAANAAGVPQTDDFNGPDQDGAGIPQMTMRHGRRWSAADAFLHPIRKRRENLTVRTGTLAHRVLLDGGRAAGVVLAGGEVVRAEREVVLAAGAFGTPQLLMLSGIGPADHLRSVGVTPAVDSPHVGANLEDHPLIGLTYVSRDTNTLLDAEHPRRLAEYVLRRGGGKLASNVAEALCFVRLADGAAAPDVEFHFAPAYYVDNGFKTWPGHAFTLGPSFLRPRSRGAVRLRSADPREAPAIRVGWLSEPEDMRLMIAGVALGREIAETGPLGAIAERNIDPGPGVRSDAQVEAWLRANVQHTYHAACTCRMGDVLDADLRVLGVDGLRVADASALPTVTTGNTNAPVLMLAERASDLLCGVTTPGMAAAAPAAVA